MNPLLSRAAAVLGATVLLAATPAWSSSFSYTYINTSMAQVVPDDAVRFAGDRYEDFNQLGVAGSYQILDFLALGLAGNTVFNDQGDTEISADTRHGFLAFPLPFGQRFDLFPVVGYQKTEFEFCAARSCTRDDNEGATYGAGLRLWLEPDKVELSASYRDNNIDGTSSASGVGLGVWINARNRLGLDFVDQPDQSLFGLSYQYSW